MLAAKVVFGVDADAGFEAVAGLVDRGAGAVRLEGRVALVLEGGGHGADLAAREGDAGARGERGSERGGTGELGDAGLDGAKDGAHFARARRGCGGEEERADGIAREDAVDDDDVQVDVEVEAAAEALHEGDGGVRARGEAGRTREGEMPAAQGVGERADDGGEKARIERLARTSGAGRRTTRARSRGRSRGARARRDARACLAGGAGGTRGRGRRRARPSARGVPSGSERISRDRGWHGQLGWRGRPAPRSSAPAFGGAMRGGRIRYFFRLFCLSTMR